MTPVELFTHFVVLVQVVGSRNLVCSDDQARDLCSTDGTDPCTSHVALQLLVRCRSTLSSTSTAPRYQ